MEAANYRTVSVTVQRRYPLFPKVCPVCHDAFMGTKYAVYDKTACKRRAAWQRNGPKANLKRAEGRP